MLSRGLIIIGTVLAIIMAGAVSLMSGSVLSASINLALPEGWHITTPKGLDSDLKQSTLPTFQLDYQGCPLLQGDNLQLQWFDEQSLSLQQATVDYHCLMTLPSSESTESSKPKGDTFATVLALLPKGEVRVEALNWVNLPENLQPRLKALLSTPSRSHLRWAKQILSAEISQQQLHLKATLAEQTLKGEITYQRSETEQHRLTFKSKIAENFDRLPETLHLDYQWQLPDSLISQKALQKGQSSLTWQSNAENHLKGEWQVASALEPENQLILPFRFDQKSLIIEQGRLAGHFIDAFPIKGFLSAKITPKRFRLDDLFPLQTDLRLSLLSQNEKGKGNVVISSQGGEIQANSLNLPLQITGNLKHQNYILYSSIPLNLSGDYHALTLRFLQGALLRATGSERLLTIHDLRFPLAGVRIDQHGINGRLQAIFKGESPDFKRIELHLDGYAKNFKAGAGTVFRDPAEKQAVKDQWQWRFWGNSQLASLKTPISLAGRGLWHKNLIQLTEFQGNLAKVKQNGMLIPQTTLSLTEPIKFAYEKAHLTGGVAIKSPKIAFDYGGELERPVANLTFNGEVENLNLKGDLTAGKLGPLRFFARRELTPKASRLLGKIYWSEQPANVFQSLFPFRQNWVITGGTIKGETAFSLTPQQGFTAGGHYGIRQGSLSLPKGNIKGIEFSLPYQFKNNEVDIGVKKPLEVRIAEVDLGLPIHNVRVKIHGHLPFNRRHPLYLQELSLNLLGGSLNVERFALPQRQVAILNLKNIHFEKILELAQYHQLNLTGKANAQLPFWLSGKPCYICNGSLTQNENSYLTLSPELIEALKKAGYTEQILAYLVNESEIHNLDAYVEVDSQGEMNLAAQLRSQLAEHQNAKINLNYTHKENLFDLWQLISYGSQFEQKIEHSLYKQLDKRR
ncbi:hypothetical protein A4G19_01785 [Pasteurellaceae bacterium Macca]|nr:hypothetical protein [Pasteurellaceae bacterium Macca]